MSVSLSKGQKADLTKTNPDLSRLAVCLGWETASNVNLDAAAFMLQASGKCRGDEDFVFYGNPSARNNAVVHNESADNPDRAQLSVNLSSVPEDINKIAFTLTIYDAAMKGQSFKQVYGVYIRLLNPSNQTELLRFNLGNELKTETAIVVAELYRYNGEWKFNAVGMGYQGGLAALCQGFGIQVTDKPATQAQKEAAPASEAIKPKQKINLQKIELRKKGDKINLEKKPDNRLGEILVNLNWSRNTAKSKGFFGSLLGSNKGVDLDLGCLYELKNGKKGVIQALGNNFGSLNNEPYISLDGDDRTGDSTTGENLRINGNYLSQFKRILVYTFIYEGVPSWAQADGVVTIKQPGGPDIEVRLTEHSSTKTMCAIAKIENVNNETLSIERVVQYFSGHKELDKAFGYGFRWVPGKKD